MSLFGPPNIEKLQRDRNIKQLIKALKYKRDEVIRWKAAIALGQFGASEAYDALIAALNDPIDKVRGDVCEALGKIGDSRAISALLSALGSKGDWTRKGAARGLGILKDARAVEALHAALRSSFSNSFGQEDILRALNQIGDPRSVSALIDALERLHSTSLVLALTGLGQLGDTRAVTPILNLEIRDGYGVATIAKIQALGLIGDPKAVKYLCCYLGTWQTVNESVCNNYALRALVQIGEPAIDELLKVKAHTMEWVDKNKGNEGTISYMHEQSCAVHIDNIIGAIKKDKASLRNLGMLD